MINLRMAFAVDSTQDLAMEAARGGAPSGTAFFAEVQREGRGRRVGEQPRRWVAPAGSSIQVSILSRHAASRSPGPSLTLGVGVAVAETLRGLLPSAEVRLKWPNDLLLNERKLGGILVEGQLYGDEHLIVIGLGLNVNLAVETLPAELQATATSLQHALGAPQDRLTLLGAILPAILNVAQEMEDPEARRGVLQRWRHLAAVAGRPLQIERDGAQVRATALGIDDDGALQALPDGATTPITIRSGEVRWLPGAP